MDKTRDKSKWLLTRGESGNGAVGDRDRRDGSQGAALCSILFGNQVRELCTQTTALPVLL